MDCFDESVASRDARGVLPPEESARLAAHALTCEACRARLARAAEQAAQGAPSLHSQKTLPLRAGQGAEASPPEEGTLPRGTTLGRYVLLDALGHGGMGVVYAAYDTKLDRRVALKLLHAGRPAEGAEGTGTSADRTRLLREAQAMAQLSHPNVVAVYDVGEVDGHIAMAMELVEGQTLRQWWKARPRDWREVLDVLVEAGRGLAAAHAVGLVHRDFKPSNVLVGRDGRVRVTDFGLARTRRSWEEQPQPAGLNTSLLESSSGKLLDLQLTRVGAVVGTPSYMAAELLEGQPADARSDQYAFCVALWEGLYGELPFAGGTLEERVQQVKEGRLRPPPAGTRVPARLHRVLLRGLSVAPEARFPSMEALLGALDRRPEVARRRLAVTAAGVLVLGASGMLAWTSWRNRSAQLCRGAEARLEGLWDGERQARMEQAFLATGAPYARDAWERVRQVVGAYARDWTAMHHETCEATRLRGEQTEAVMTLRMACLDKRLQEVAALADVFSEADTVVVGKATQAAAALSPLRACADVEALLAEVKPPQDAATQAKVEALRARLARAKALTDSGKQRESVEVTSAAIGEARDIGYPPVLAEALFAQGTGLVLSGDLNAAAEVLADAVWEAVAARHDRVALAASVRLVGVHSVRGRREEAALWDRQASALLTRMGGDDEWRAGLLNNRGVGFLTRNEMAQGLATFQEGLTLAHQKLPPTHPTTMKLEANVLAALLDMGRYAEAARGMEEAVRHAQETLGLRHPALAPLLLNAARVHTNQGRLRQARATLERLLQMGEVSFTPGSSNWAQYCAVAGRIEELEGRYEEALAHHEEALRLFTLSMGEDSPSALAALMDVASMRQRTGALEEAQRLFERALAVVERTEGKEHPDVASPLMGLADLQELRGQHARALELRRRAWQASAKGYGEEHPYTWAARAELAASEVQVARAPGALEALAQAVRHMEATVGPSSPLLVPVLERQGEALVAMSRPLEARPPLERAARLAKALLLDPNEEGRVDAVLARVALATGEVGRAARLASEAEAAFARAPLPDARRRGELAAWRRQHARLLGGSPVAQDAP